MPQRLVKPLLALLVAALVCGSLASVLPAYAAASESGAALVVGPLTRDDLKTVLALALARPRMLALNQLEDGSALPDEVYA